MTTTTLTLPMQPLATTCIHLTATATHGDDQDNDESRDNTSCGILTDSYDHEPERRQRSGSLLGLDLTLLNTLPLATVQIQTIIKGAQERR